MGVTGQSLPPQNDFEHARGPHNSTYAVNLTYDRHMHIYIYHAKSRLNTPVWGSLRSPNRASQFARRIFFCSTHLLQGLALKQQFLFLFGFFISSVFVSGCIQTLTSASCRCRFHRCLPSRPFIHALLLLSPSPCNSVVYFAFLSPLSAA